MAQTFHRYRAGDKPVGGYKLVRKLGEGGFGEVWQASAPGGAEVALKFIDLTGQQGFREFKSLRLVKRITHNNLTPLHGFWLKNEDGTLIDESDVTWSQLAPIADGPANSSSGSLATAVYTHPVELIVAMGLGKKSLYDRLRECKDDGLGGIPADELLDYMDDAARGIDYLNRPIHDMGQGPVPIVHSDIKPHNILVVGDGAQVCDFGLAHAVESLRKTCQAPLTLAYAAPESFRGKPCDKSDQYSLGVTYVELRTGSLPFDDGMTGYEVMTAHVQGLLDFSRLTPSEAAVIKKATAALPQDRWKNCREMILELRRALRLSTDSTFMAETPNTPAAYPRPSAPVDRAVTALPPGSPPSETATFSGPTPTERDPALQIKTPAVSTPVILSGPLERPAVPRRRISTAAKLFVSIVLLAGMGVTGAYFYFTAANDDPVAKKKREDEEKQKQGEAQKERDRIAKEEDDARLREQAKNAPKLAFEDYLNKEQFASALNLLKSSNAFSEAEISSNRGRVKELWRKRADSRFDTREYAPAAEDYQGLVEHFGGEPDAGENRLLLSRAILLSTAEDKYQLAKTELDSIAAAANLSGPARSTYEVVATILEGRLNDRFDDVDKVLLMFSRTDVASGNWKISDGEKNELIQAMRLSTGRWLKKSGIAADVRAQTLDRIVKIDPENMDALLAQVEAYVQRSDFAKASAALQALPQAKLQSSQKDLYAALAAYTALANPESDAKLVTKTLKDLSVLLKSQRGEGRKRLATGMTLLVKRDLQMSKDALAKLEPYKADPEIEPLYAEILYADLPRRLLSLSDLSEDTANKLQADCALIRKHVPPDKDELLRACEAECLLTLELDGAKEKLGASGSSPYFHYVRALALAAEPAPPWPDVLDSLSIVITPEPSPLLRVAGRGQRAVALLDRLSNRVRNSTGELELATLFKEPVNQSETAVYQLLRNAYRWPGDVAKLSEHSLACLALAAQWMPAAPDPALARDLTARLTAEWQKSDRDKGLAGDLVFSVYFTCWTAHKGLPGGGQQIALNAARRMMLLGQLDSFSLEKQAPYLYTAVLEPSWETAVAARNDGFFDDLASFIKAFRGETWPFASGQKKASVAEQLELIYTQAIALSEPKNPAYFYKRGYVRLEKRPADVAAALADAAELERLKAGPHLIYDLQGYSYFIKSRLQKTASAKLIELQRALDAFRHLEQPGVLTADQQALVFLLFSMVHLERGNYSGSLNQRLAFADAATYAQKALDAANAVTDSDKRKNMKERAFLAMGNAYEDLAWIARSEVEANYKKAVASFISAKSQIKSGTSKKHLGRCYYKIVAESDEQQKGKIIPRKTKFLDMSREDVLAAAERELKEAIESHDLDNRAEAHHYLGRVLQVKGLNENVTAEEAKLRLPDTQFHAASAELKKAADIAKENALSDVYISNYTLAWAEHALLHPGFYRSPNLINQARIAVNERADALRQLNLSSTVAFDPDQEAAIVLAKADSLGKGPIAFLQALDPAADKTRKQKPADASRSDDKLMRLRIQQRDQIYEKYREDITQKMAETAYDEAQWYANVPDGVARNKEKIELFYQASEFFDQMTLTEPNRRATYRKGQADSLLRAIDVDRKDLVVATSFTNLVAIWDESMKANRSVPAAEQIEMGTKLAALAASLIDELKDDPKRKNDLSAIEKLKPKIEKVNNELKKAVVPNAPPPKTK